MRVPSFISGFCLCVIVACGQSDGDLVQRYRYDLQKNPRDSLTHYLLAALGA
jgi:hypothetical protein